MENPCEKIEQNRHSPSLLEKLANEILQKSTQISSYLAANHHAQPSFDRDAPITCIPSNAPPEIRKARQDLMEGSLKAFQLATGPSEYIPHLALGFHYLACLRWLAYFNIFAKVPLQGSVPYEILAEEANVSETQLKAIARMAMTHHLFCETEPNHIAHTATSALFVTNPETHDWAMFMSEKSASCASKILEASVKWPKSLAKNNTAFNVAYGTDKPFFEWLDTQPSEREQFAKYMRMIQQSEGMSLSHLVDGFDWASLGKATVVDVGGSTGAASIALAKSFPDLNFIVQDLSGNTKSGAASLNEPSLAGRILFQEHNFFDIQPFNGADVYLLRMIIHDWQLEDAVKILQQLLPALKKGSRIVIMDIVLPTPGTIPTVQEGLLRARDLTMLQSFNSTERDITEWTALVKKADPNLQIINIVQPVGSIMAVLEIVWEHS
ncbi:S-adenosyl-L-methionine-dependent methyltransferase [Aspergillus novoparasiticus]|uniref:S-adenosyl-L-methionine-dependent methyltransferase n=1 Tax=Aspergillus novoparasiticus TaxID=986946 RepID=A0A5N6EQ76_9EURO|nr:S-adenosyl-L-methionine-dependent methyltransferase [Aspergillus novoparasiticus]